MANNECTIYKGYILAPGIQMPSYDIYETDIFENREQYEQGSPIHTSDNDDEAKAWLDRYIESRGGVQGSVAWPRAVTEGSSDLYSQKTYDDWLSLGKDIRGKDPTAGTGLEVSFALNTILEEERGEAEEDAGYTAKDAKWWLIEKATELGVI